MEKKKERRRNHMGIPFRLTAPLPWVDCNGYGYGSCGVGMDVVGGRVAVSVMVDCGCDDARVEVAETELDVGDDDDNDEEEKEDEAEEGEDEEIVAGLEVDKELCIVSEPITMVIFPRTMHARLLLDAQG
jgi:hypothetical protein